MAGGRSSRMGTDKAALLVDGVPLLERTAGIAMQSGLPVRVVGRESPLEWNLPEVSFMEDMVEDCGPMGGLLTALTNAETDILLLACDMPFMSISTLHWLIEEHDRQILEDGLITTDGIKLQPLFSIYTPRSLPSIMTGIRSRSLAMYDFIDSGRFRFITLPEAVASAVRDIDTPGDLEMLTGRDIGESRSE